ncbi:hypothetical protein [Qipengyuania soli]|uniref:Uncharacterized protein n=1 Tax=Qipengyuania soli TaxID=2782568 RepID=A0A7S8F3D6_9SPHN|nr:hypothetical protein [Qipengyuania soli]QPC98393.1 hypothetical protein IRL76_11090 [Qipengyuania soli]
MGARANPSAYYPGEIDLAVRLDLDGERLGQALSGMLASAEAHGGIEKIVEALNLKTELFADAFADGAKDLTPENFLKLLMFMPTVRRRVGDYLEGANFLHMKQAIGELLAEGDTDERIARFTAAFPASKRHRWVRDLACEILHNSRRELYPLMTRWVWDHKANSGVLREIWFADDVDNMLIDVADNYATFLKLREELAGYLTDNGVFRDVPCYVDLVCAQVYAGYIASQGGAFLKADFASEQDSFLFVLRLLGLDGVQAKAADVSAREDDDAIDLSDIMTTSRLMGNA